MLETLSTKGLCCDQIQTLSFSMEKTVILKLEHLIVNIASPPS